MRPIFPNRNRPGWPLRVLLVPGHFEIPIGGAS